MLEFTFQDYSFLALKIVKDPKRAALEMLLIKDLKLERPWSVDLKSKVFSADSFALLISPLTLTSQQKRKVLNLEFSRSVFNEEYLFNLFGIIMDTFRYIPVVIPLKAHKTQILTYFLLIIFLR